MKDDLEELGLALHWRKLCKNREKWGKSVKPVKRKDGLGRVSRRKDDKGREAIPRFESFGQTKGEGGSVESLDGAF